MIPELDNYKVDGDCWIWQGKTDSTRYGWTMYKSKKIGVHRLSYLVHKGPLKKGFVICHTCDHKLCINPEHLYQGSVYDNIGDYQERQLKRLRILAEQVKGIREAAYYNFMTTEAIATKFGVTPSQVNRIVNMKFRREIHPVCRKPAVGYILREWYMIPLCEEHWSAFPLERHYSLEAGRTIEPCSFVR